jgi:hypothetical protein
MGSPKTSPIPSEPPSKIPEPPNPGITVLKVLIVAALVVGALNLATFAVEAWRGTLDQQSLRRFLAKAAFGVVLIGYVIQKIRTKTPF